MRVNQYLAQQLEISRRRADALIAQGSVLVNDQLAEPGQQIAPGIDAVSLNGRPLLPRQTQRVTVALYKPRKVISSKADPRGRPTVMELLPPELSGLNPVGRLDYDSEGLLLLSNDGAFIDRMTHPRYEKQKVYQLFLDRPVSDDLIAQFQEGIRLQEGVARADHIAKIGKRLLEVTIHQGWNRQLRRMAEACDNRVRRLIRARFGDIPLGDLKPGEWKYIHQSRDQ